MVLVCNIILVFDEDGVALGATSLKSSSWNVFHELKRGPLDLCTVTVLSVILKNIRWVALQ